MGSTKQVLVSPIVWTAILASFHSAITVVTPFAPLVLRALFRLRAAPQVAISAQSVNSAGSISSLAQDRATLAPWAFTLPALAPRLAALVLQDILGTLQVYLYVIRVRLASPKSDLARSNVKIARPVSTPVPLGRGIASFVVKAIRKSRWDNLRVIPVPLVRTPIRQVRQGVRTVQQAARTPLMVALCATFANRVSITARQDKLAVLTLWSGTTKIMKALPKPKSARLDKFPLWMERLRVLPARQDLINLPPARRDASTARLVLLLHCVVPRTAPRVVLVRSLVLPAN